MKLSRKNKLVLGIGFGIGIILIIFTVNNSLKVLEEIITPQPPENFNLFFAIKKEKNNKGGYYREFEVDKPSIYQFFIAPNFNADKVVRFSSKEKFVGLYTNEITLLEGNYGSSQVSLFLFPGKYQFYVNFGIPGATIYFYTNVYLPDVDYVNRITKVEKGDIYNPPKNYRELYRTNLSGLEVNNLSIAKFSISNSGEYSFSAYSTRCSRGRFSLRLVGGGYQGIDLLNQDRYISDQVSIFLPRGVYEIFLSSYNADCRVVLYMTNYAPLSNLKD